MNQWPGLVEANDRAFDVQTATVRYLSHHGVVLTVVSANGA